MYGFPRAGNTLLGCILNQNPRINATANSVLPEIMFSINNIKFYDTAYNNFPDESLHKALYTNVGLPQDIPS